jgi:DNA repair photolyase
MSDSDQRLPIIGRGAQLSPPNRYQRMHVEESLEHVEHDADYLSDRELPRTEYFEDDSQSIVSNNDSPDIPFDYSLNPYRGCAHGCAYCYARPTHEYLGLSAGLDFETKIFVKPRAAQLFREFLSRSSWQAEPIMLSGVTDCYQGAERHFQLTRQCLEVASAANQPMMITTKNALVARDLDILAPMAQRQLISVAISITSLDQSLTKILEPRTSAPTARLRAVRELADAGVPVVVMVAPIIPGLNDDEMPAILQAAAQHGAHTAYYTMLRLPTTVRPIFLDWVERFVPAKQQRIENAIRSVRDGQLNSAEWGNRMRGTGVMADQLSSLFKILKKKHGLDRPSPKLDRTQFQPPADKHGQLRLF